MEKQNENKKTVVRVAEYDPEDTQEALPGNTKNKTERLKKPVIFILMGIAFLGCMYLIFKPSFRKKETEKIGLNDAVPQATDVGLQSDKQKAYELEILERKEQEKREGLMSLSDYWNTESADKSAKEEEMPDNEEEKLTYGTVSSRNTNSAVNSYRETQSTLSNFYQEESNPESQSLRKELEDLKQQLAEKEATPDNTIENQLALMEKSYQMAAKYLPPNTVAGQVPLKNDSITNSGSTNKQEYFVGFTPARKNTVSALYREPADSVFTADWSAKRNLGFYTAGSLEEVAPPRNGIRAVIHETKKLIGESDVRLRLLENANTPHYAIPEGTLLTANATFQGDRLHLKVISVEWQGNIIPVHLTIYDLDGQEGLRIPFSAEMNALTEMAANMSQTSGTSLMLTQSAGQQVAADLSRGAVQGISGYFSKKIRAPKVTVKSGHQLFLVSKK